MINPKRHTPLLPGTLENLFYPPPDYKYYDQAAEVPFTVASPIAKAAWAVDSAVLAYARRGQEQMADDDLDQIFARAGLGYVKVGGTPENWNAPGTQAFFASNADFAILAFRGTEKSDAKDAVSDLDLLLSHEPDYRPASLDPDLALGHLSFVSQLFSMPCLVHRGFQLALNQVWEDVHRLVTEYHLQHPQAEICFTGHSLGAGLAVLAYSRFRNPNISLYTFGGPRVGNAAFRNRVMENPAKGIYRFVNFNDAITHVPTESLLYVQTPETSCRFTEDGDLGSDDGTFKGDLMAFKAAIEGLPASIRFGDLSTIPAPPSLVDHSPGRYCYRIWDCV